MSAPPPRSSQAPRAAIEGSLREVTLADVLQLLDLGSRSGVLRVEDPLGRRRARVVVVAGRVCGAAIDEPGSHDDADDATRRAVAASARAVLDTVVDLLGWESGRFAVDPLPASLASTPRRGGLAVDTLLMEAARRADEWSVLADLVPNARAVIALVEPPRDASGTLALAPVEWAVLAVADGTSDVRTLADRLGREILDVARSVHRLVGEGLLTASVPNDGPWSSES